MSSDDAPSRAELAGMLEAERRRRQDLEQRLADVESQLQDATATNQQIVSKLAGIRTDLDGLAGLSEAEESTAKKRRRDLFIALQRRAKNNDGEFAMDYNEVKEVLETFGHGEIKDPQAYRDLRWIADRVRGCYSSQHPVSGNEAVSIDLDAIHGTSLEEATGSNDVSSQETGGARSDQQLTDKLPILES